MGLLRVWQRVRRKSPSVRQFEALFPPNGLVPSQCVTVRERRTGLYFQFFKQGKEMFLFGWHWGSWSEKIRREIISWARTPEFMSDREPKKADTIRLKFKIASPTAAAPFLCAFYTSSISPSAKPECVTDPAFFIFFSFPPSIFLYITVQRLI